MKATIVLKAAIDPRAGMVVVRGASEFHVLTDQNNNLLGKASDVFLVYAEVDRFKIHHGGKQFYKECYLILDKDDIKYILKNKLIYKEVEGSLFVNPYASIWSTIDAGDKIFKLAIHPDSKPDSLSMIIKTKEQGDEFMKKLDDLSYPVKRLPIKLNQLSNDMWHATYENCSGYGRTANHAETSLYKVIHSAYTELEGEHSDSRSNKSIQRLPITLTRCEDGVWVGSYETCVAEGNTAEEAEINLYSLIDIVFKDIKTKIINLNLELLELKPSE